MSDRVAAAALLHERAGAELLVEGWVEGPCAQAADLRGINTLLTDFYDDPGFVRDLFEFAVAQELRFAAAQVAVGVDIIGVGDAAASLVGPRIYREFVWPYEKKLVDGLHALGTPRAPAYLRQYPAAPGPDGPARLRDRRPGLSRAAGRSPPERWGQIRCCWATWTPCGPCVTARLNRWSQRSPGAIARPAPLYCGRRLRVAA